MLFYRQGLLLQRLLFVFSTGKLNWNVRCVAMADW